ncbi:hypothetical protein OAM69_03940 [bacterium]|nr:hypothetical protein [bacterium]
MSLGYRVFFVVDEEVYRIAQKRFNALYLKKAAGLSQYSNQTVISVLVVYEIVNRKPNSIVRIDTQKIRFGEDGFVDEAYEDEGFRLAAAKIDDVINSALIMNDAIVMDDAHNIERSVVDASKRFDERRWKQRHPELSDPVLKKILKGVFGSAS